MPDITAIIVLSIVLVSGAVITLGVVGMQHRSKVKAIDVLKTYAEKGEEPSAAVLDAVNRINWPFPPPPPPRPKGPSTRSENLAQVASNVVISLGAAGFAWWRAQLGDTGLLMIIAVILAIFFAAAAAAAAARLVAALTAGDGR